MLSLINLNSIVKFLTIIFVAIIQITVMPYFSIYQAMGNIILIAMIIFLGRKEYLKGFLWVILGAIFLDFSLGLGMGPYLATFLIVFFLFYFIQSRIISENIFVINLVLIFVAAMIFDIVFLVFLKIIEKNTGIILFWPIVLKDGVFNTMLFAIIYPIYYFIEQKIFPRADIKLSGALDS